MTDGVDAPSERRRPAPGKTPDRLRVKSTEDTSMEHTPIIGIDASARSFRLHGAAAEGRPVFRKTPSRGRSPAFLSDAPSCLQVWRPAAVPVTGAAGSSPWATIAGRSRRSMPSPSPSACRPTGMTPPPSPRPRAQGHARRGGEVRGSPGRCHAASPGHPRSGNGRRPGISGAARPGPASWRRGERRMSGDCAMNRRRHGSHRPNRWPG